jgi:hypothetical protein
MRSSAPGFAGVAPRRGADNASQMPQLAAAQMTTAPIGLVTDRYTVLTIFIVPPSEP